MKSHKKKHLYSSTGLSYMKPRAAKKATNMMAQASELQYLLYECSKCKVIVHAKCCGGSFPSIHYPRVDKRHEKQLLKQNWGLERGSGKEKDNQWFAWYC